MTSTGYILETTHSDFMLSNYWKILTLSLKYFFFLFLFLVGSFCIAQAIPELWSPSDPISSHLHVLNSKITVQSTPLSFSNIIFTSFPLLFLQLELQLFYVFSSLSYPFLLFFLPIFVFNLYYNL